MGRQMASSFARISYRSSANNLLLDDGRDFDLQYVDRQMLMADLVFRAQWRLLLHFFPVPRVLFDTPDAPELGPDTAERFHPFDTVHGVALGARLVATLGRSPCRGRPLSAQRVVIIGRRGDPPFVRSELTRLAYLRACR